MTPSGAGLRLGMVGGGQGALIGAVHRLAARMDDRYELSPGCFAGTAERSRASAAELGVAPERAYGSYAEMAERERGRADPIDVGRDRHAQSSASAGRGKAFLEAGFDVICDKPLTATLAEAEELASRSRRAGRVFVLSHNYTAYPMVRRSASMVASGALGGIRVVQVEYPQDWLATPLEQQGQKQAEWRTDPARSGPGGTWPTSARTPTTWPAS